MVSPKQMAIHLGEWYDLLAQFSYVKASAEDKRSFYFNRSLHWREQALLRSPYHANMHMYYGQGLWSCASQEKGAKQAELFEKVYYHLRRASDLTPTVAKYKFDCAACLKRLDEVYRGIGEEKRADRYGEAARQMIREGKAIEDKWMSLGLPAR